MKKYFETSKIIFKTQIAYRFDIIASMVFTISKILLAYVLWKAVFKTQNIVSGFTFDAMLSYYIISSFLTQLDQSSVTGWQIAEEIKNGRFSKYIVKPIGIFRFFTAQTAGRSAFLLLFNLIASLIWIFIFHVSFVISTSIWNILSALVLTLLGLLFMMQVNYFIGILAFKFVDTSIFMMIKDNMVQFITGSLIPLVLLPPEIIRTMSFFPFYYISYLPSMLLLGKNQNEALSGFVILSLWNLAFGILNSTAYKKLKSEYDGVGI
ncbi:MAG TPA: ABC-2 family transporter protein [Pseudobacteroides sp.]|uniref:ABC transporter permease n=1 Tax=Pseudobacteroides sp. TaxID=1968840 RepID=UPI002F952511